MRASQWIRPRLVFRRVAFWTANRGGLRALVVLTPWWHLSVGVCLRRWFLPPGARRIEGQWVVGVGPLAVTWGRSGVSDGGSVPAWAFGGA